MCHFFVSSMTPKPLKDLVLTYKTPMRNDNCPGLVFGVNVLSID